NSFNYVYVIDGKVHSTSTYNGVEDVAAEFIPGTWYNGASMETQVAMTGETRTIKFTLIGAESSANVLHPYAEFSKLLARAGLMELGNSLSFQNGHRVELFANDLATRWARPNEGTDSTEPALEK